MIYVKYSTPDLYQKHVKTMGVLASILSLSTHESRLVRAKFDDIVKSTADFEPLVEVLEKILLSLPFCSYPAFVEIFVEAFLFS